ncbi:SHOCT domain-containing protein [Rhodococcus jostii]|uniref:Short C-terminal domain-containing protein n=1 Tax=Rhodococcus jostii TaxID=132919 RepID=A0A1H4QJZ2_RHOJO|nr:SHOCT domain-containing protein [Rhodococcus jostii]SEC19937.1 Short C-terminal domain-containing protein [Rhodococcus jostii]
MPGLLRGIARTAVVAGTATTVSNRVSRRQGRRWAADEPPPPAAPAQPPAPPPAAGVDRLTALKQLGELHDQGVLTDDEFNTEKAKILAS